MILAMIVILGMLPFYEAWTQSDETRRPIDMMIVLDNSCSMFPKEKIVPGCEVWGNDPDFLRISGVHLFVASLGFGAPNALEYQAGVISLGKEAKVVSPLQPLNDATRAAIARLVKDPSPELGTNMIDAIQLAYQELRTSPARRATNLPAVVLMTDGRPYPDAGQSDADLERLVSANPDIPFFIMLLQDSTDSDYEQYVRFWEQMQTRYDHVFTYRITDRDQIDSTYNQIVAQLQNTIADEGGTDVMPGMPYPFFVSKCVQGITIKIRYELDEEKGVVTVQDPNLDIVDLNTAVPGVAHFREEDNSVEVISIGPARLTDDLKNAEWMVTSDKPVRVYLDRWGAYSIDFEAPEVSLTDISNVYLATERHTPGREFALRFRLTSDCYDGKPQPVWGDVILPSGEKTPLRVPAGLAPDSAGIYEIRYDFASAYPAILDAPGRFIFALHAGSALEEDLAETRIPIATARLIVDVGRAPYVADVLPATVTCGESGVTELTVTVGDYELAVPSSSIHIRAIAGGQQVDFAPSTSPDVFTADVGALCTALSSGAMCSTTTPTELRVRLTAQMASGPMPAAERGVPVQVFAPTCTPTPSPSPTPTPTPTPPPTPCPDRDGDGLNDCGADRCPDAPGIVPLQGCPWWPYALGAFGALLLLFALLKWGIPWIKIHTCCPPPKAFVLICQGGKSAGVKGTYGIGMAKLTNRITIGGDRKKAHIYVQGLKPVEFYVMGKGEQIQIFDAATGAMKGTFKDIPSDVATSNIDVKLRIGLEQGKLGRC